MSAPLPSSHGPIDPARRRHVLGEDYVLPYVALEWDHAIGSQAVRWLVVRCADIVGKCGGPQSLAPRSDVAYFVHETTAAADARLFASLKNRAEPWGADQGLAPADPAHRTFRPLERHCVFEWDHLILAGAPLRWGVLEWCGAEALTIDPNASHPRTDVAYFLDPTTAEADARAFAAERDRTVAASP